MLMQRSHSVFIRVDIFANLPRGPLQDHYLLSIYAGPQGVSELTLKTLLQKGYLKYRTFK